MQDFGTLAIHQVFERQAARTPTAVAIRQGDTVITYRELDERGNELACALRARGIGPDAVVAILLERSIELVVGMLAVLKAGAAYLPLDPAFPAERIRFILDDAQASLLLTSDALALSIDPIDCSILDARASEPAGQATQPAYRERADSAALAYVIYTSGSTGLPKGVEITHHNVIRLFDVTRTWFSFAESDVWTLFHSSAFDFSVWEIWGALLHGGTLVIVPSDVARSPWQFAALLRSRGVTVLNLTPSAFYELLRIEAFSHSSTPHRLRIVILGGEAIDVRRLAPWFALPGTSAARLVNMYGITETTVHVTYRPIVLEDCHASIRSPIGLPLPDLRVHLLDDAGQPVPPGAIGELCVAGPGLGRGYRNRPALTAERFVERAVDGSPAVRVYHSGDLARYTANGELEYLGRKDEQVKIRGFRVELGEIEGVLYQNPAVSQCVVVAREDRPGEKRLVAYVVLKAEEERVEGGGPLLAYLRQRLPEYMVPVAVILLAKIPLTTNGKVDRRALPIPDYTHLRPDLLPVAPRTRIEEVLAHHWQEVLGLEVIGIHDNFFELGGDSLLAVALLTRINAAFNVEVPTTALFAMPFTIANIATLLRDAIAQQLSDEAFATLLTTIDAPHR